MKREIVKNGVISANNSGIVVVNEHLENGLSRLTPKQSLLNKRQLPMERYIWIGLLSISFCFGHIFAQKPPTSFYIDIDGNKKSFLFKEEVSIDEYNDILRFLKQEYGEDSEQYKFMIPDTAKFMAWYGFPFFYQVVGSSRETIEMIRKQHKTLPMVAISYEQATAYCQWSEIMINIRDSVINKRNKSYTWQCSLPEKVDYEIALKKAKITQQEFLSTLQADCIKCRKIINGTICEHKRRCNSIFGLTDNISEYTQGSMLVEGGKNIMLKFAEAKDSENPIGFRCKVTLVSKK